MKSNVILAIAFATVASGFVAGCGENPVPEMITYEKDVGPLLNARCVRCHGAGGTLNKDPDISPAWIAGKMTDGMPDHHDTPQSAMFDTLAHAKMYANGFVKLWLDYPMPPPPGAQLTDREREILLNWTGE
ncbi:MAG TPA: hypothetical protein VHJ20_08030 [Polyangia bacterium]|nr:hypothetical protein [Polyangia bacterium]